MYPGILGYLTMEFMESKKNMHTCKAAHADGDTHYSARAAGASRAASLALRALRSSVTNSNTS